jgi:hypothetical protein
VVPSACPALTPLTNLKQQQQQQRQSGIDAFTNNLWEQKLRSGEIR